MAQAGATLAMRGVTPANKPFTPFDRKIFASASLVLVFGTVFGGLSVDEIHYINSKATL